MGGRRGTVEQRFWPKVAKTTAGECWEWQASLSSNGYGCLRVAGVTRTAHTLAWELANGPIPDGLWVLHRCDVRACCNPAHLFLGTATDNARDMVQKKRHRPSMIRGDAHPCTRLSEQRVAELRLEHAAGASIRSLSVQCGVSYQQIWNIVRNKTRLEAA